MKDQKYFVIDFDSTFTKVEALDALGEISLKTNDQKDTILQEIKAITDQCMEGELSFRQSLDKRIKLLEAKKDHIEGNGLHIL